MATVAKNNWCELFDAVMLELDETKLPQRIEDARHTILDRIEDLLQGNASQDHQEQLVLRDALNAITDLGENIAQQHRTPRKPNASVRDAVKRATK